MAKKKKTDTIKKKQVAEATILLRNDGDLTEKQISMVAKAINVMSVTEADTMIKAIKKDPESVVKYIRATRKSKRVSGAISKATKPVKDIQVYLKEANDKDKKIQLPIVPASFSISDGQNNVVVNITSLGDANLPGKKSLRELTLSSFFPNHDYGFLVCSRKKDPYDYIDWLQKRKNNGTIMRVIITGTNINFTCLIEKLEYGEDDASGDVNFTINLKEYVKLKSSESKESSKRQSKSKPKTYTVKKGDTLKKIAKKYLGSGSKSKSLYKKNKKVIENAFKKWKKAQKKKGKKVKAKNSQNGKYLIKGTKLTL